MEVKNYKAHYDFLLKEIKDNGLLNIWEDVRDYILPYTGKFNMFYNDNSEELASRGDYINNSTPTKAIKNLASGLHGGLTSPSRAWFKLDLEKEEYTEDSDVQEWLQLVRDKMLSIFAGSNFYTSAYNLYLESPAYGIAVMLIERDFNDTVRFTTYTIGEFLVDTNRKGKIDTLFLHDSLTVKQVVEEFGIENVSTSVSSLYKNNHFYETVKIIHCIKKNDYYGKKDMVLGDKRYISVYFEKDTPDDKFLKVSGYRTKPFVAPRWEVISRNKYGNSPARDVLSDSQMLQVMEQDKIETLDKHVNPPVNAPSSLKKRGGVITPKGVNYVDMMQGSGGVTPVYQTSGDIQSLAIEIQTVEQRIKEGLFNNLFINLLEQTKRMTTVEVNERQTEKMVMLAPVLERLISEFLDPLIERTLSVMNEAGEIPDQPEVLKDKNIKVNYISTLAQAQKTSGTRPMEQMIMFVNSLAALNPDVLKKIDFDEMVDIYGNLVGVQAKVIKSDEDVEKARQAEQAALAQQQQQDNTQQEAQIAQTLGNTQFQGTNALDAMAGSMGQL